MTFAPVWTPFPFFRKRLLVNYPPPLFTNLLRSVPEADVRFSKQTLLARQQQPQVLSCAAHAIQEFHKAMASLAALAVEQCVGAIQHKEDLTTNKGHHKRAHISHDRDPTRGIVTPLQNTCVPEKKEEKNVSITSGKRSGDSHGSRGPDLSHPHIVKLLAFRLDRVGEQEVCQLLWGLRLRVHAQVRTNLDAARAHTRAPRGIHFDQRPCRAGTALVGPNGNVAPAGMIRKLSKPRRRAGRFDHLTTYYTVMQLRQEVAQAVGRPLMANPPGDNSGDDV